MNIKIYKLYCQNFIITTGGFFSTKPFMVAKMGHSGQQFADRFYGIHNQEFQVQFSELNNT
jgi:hypothetical protein